MFVYVSRSFSRFSKQCIAVSRQYCHEAEQHAQSIARGVSSNTVQIDDATIHYDKAGTGNHTVLLLPGALGAAVTDFPQQIQNVNKDLFTMIAWDPPGYGKSRPPERKWSDDYFRSDADYAAKLMETLGKNSYSMIGWSDGGITAMVLAANYPERVNKLVLFGANAYIADGDIKLYNAVRSIDKWSERMRKPFIDLYGEEYFRKHWEHWYQAFTKYYHNHKGDICKGDLKKITCPTFILHGDKDPMVIPEHPRFLNENIKNSRVHHFPDGKHNIHMRYYREFNSLVENFLLEQ